MSLRRIYPPLHLDPGLLGLTLVNPVTMMVDHGDSVRIDSINISPNPPKPGNRGRQTSIPVQVTDFSTLTRSLDI